MTATKDRGGRLLFAATILTGSFLLFLVQPMVARMVLPRLGGAPNARIVLAVDQARFGAQIAAALGA